MRWEQLLKQLNTSLLMAIFAVCTLAPMVTAEVFRINGAGGEGVTHLEIDLALMDAKQGDTLLVGPGSYRISRKLPSGITIQGSGPSKTTITNAGGRVRLLGAQNVRISDLTFEGVNAEDSILWIGQSSATIERVKFTGTCVNALELHGGDRAGVVSIDTAMFTGIVGVPTLVTGTTSATIRNAIYQSNVGVAVVATEQAAATFENCLFTDHNETLITVRGEAKPTFRKVTIAGSPGQGVSVLESGAPTFEDSLIVRNSSTGITILGGSATLNRTRVEGNGRRGVLVTGGSVTLNECQVLNHPDFHPALLLEKGAVGTVTGSLFVRNEFTAILAREGSTLTLTNTTVAHNENEGVWLKEDGTGTITYCIIAGQRSLKFGDGVVSWKSSNTTIGNSIVSGNAHRNLVGITETAGASDEPITFANPDAMDFRISGKSIGAPESVAVVRDLDGLLTEQREAFAQLVFEGDGDMVQPASGPQPSAKDTEQRPAEMAGDSGSQPRQFHEQLPATSDDTDIRGMETSAAQQPEKETRFVVSAEDEVKTSKSRYEFTFSATNPSGIERASIQTRNAVVATFSADERRKAKRDGFTVTPADGDAPITTIFGEFRVALEPGLNVVKIIVQRDGGADEHSFRILRTR